MQLIIVGIFFALVGDFLLPTEVMAETCETWIAKVASAQGSVQARKAGETQWTAAQRPDTFCSGVAIRVGPRSRAAIVAHNDAVYRLEENTTITITAPQAKQSFWLRLKSGAAYFFSRAPRSLRVMTPFANAGVEGTEFVVKVEGDQTLLSVFQGRVVATNAMGSLRLASGQSAIVKAGQAPAPRVLARPRDAVQWALYYPPIVDFRPEDFSGEAAWQAMVRQSIQFYQEGDLPGAFASLAKAPQDIRDPRFFTYRAALSLTVGRVEEAHVDIERALALDSHNSRVYALQSIIAVVQNRKDEALQLARQAAELDLTSSAARVALSYAQQARFELQKSLSSLKAAVALPPENALAWARLAELQLSVGEIKMALDAAQRAVALNPRVARIQTVLGFAFLTQIKLREAKHAFEKAIELDQAAPLPRLGLGLAQIRQGDLKAGREGIEIAVSLDPDNALIRSYLGKAYYEENRDKLAMDQFDMAKELDPLDPTAFFYNAIRKQSVNRPVEALQDLQTSIDLNDNRAVYRSRLLLDEDLGARSAALARIYNDLGFQQRALVEGWRALNIDPSNYSAHRFLSDSYATLPRHEIARVSELLQSQLLQPLNITPVQPQLAESALRILSGAGPATPSLNEFYPLFNRNRFGLLASGVIGNNDTWGDEVVLSGVVDRLSYSIGQFHYETDGFRENEDLKRNIYNVFLQAELSHNTNLQAELRYTDIDSGDTRRLFNPGSFEPMLREQVHFGSVRLGFRYRFTPHSDIIASFIYGSLDNDVTIAPVIDTTSDEDSYMAEVQHLLRSKQLHVTSGIGHVSVTLDEVTHLFLDPLPPIKNNMHHTNIYAYLQMNFIKNVILTLGGSADFFEDDDIDRNQFNPKLGVTWNPFPGTTLRAAAFRVLKRRVISNQTIEPTQVAGFNQFFDDLNGTDAWRYGIAIDQKFSPHLYGGIEFSARDLSVKQPNKLNREEQLGRTYLYWTSWTGLALNAEYQYENLDLDSEARNELNTAEVQTHRFSSGAGFSHPLGFRIRLQATYIDQEGSFRDTTGEIVSSDDQFWVVDASIGYRLPKRWGLITVEMRNLFDEEFRFQDTDPANPTISPERLLLARFTLAY